MLALAFAIVVWFSSLSAGLVFLIGLGFALVGGFAAVKGLHVPCNCFGEHHRSYLGWRQIVIAPLWGIPLCIQLVFNPAQFGLATKLALFVALLLVQIGLLLSEFVQTLRGELAIPWLRPSR